MCDTFDNNPWQYEHATCPMILTGNFESILLKYFDFWKFTQQGFLSGSEPELQNSWMGHTVVYINSS